MAVSKAFKRSLDHALTVYLAAACGMALLVLSVPRLVADINAIPGQRTLRVLPGNTPMTGAVFDDVSSSLVAASVWTDDGELRRDLGLARLRRALSEVDETGRVTDKALLTDAIDAFRDGLSKRPGDPMAWTWLAYAMILRDGPSEASAAALRTSILTGSVHPKIMFLRIELSSLNWPYFDPQDRDLVLRQIRIGWQISRPDVIYLATDSLRVALIRFALANSPEDLDIFERGLLRYRRTGRV